MVQDINKALLYSISIQNLYNKIKFYHYIGNDVNANKIQNDLEFLIQLEKQFYNSLINKDLNNYLKYIKRENHFTFDINSIIFNEDCFKPYLRVYYHLKDLAESRNYYNEFYLADMDENENYQ